MFYRFTPDGRQKYIDLKDMQRGAVFICGGHPSLNDEPLELLNQPGIVTMAMNNTATIIRPNIWVCADKPPCYSTSIIKDPGIMKFARLLYAGEKFSDGELMANWNSVPNMFFYGVSPHFTHKTILNDTGALVWWKNVFMIAIQLAYRLGFRKIYLCGTAFNIDPKKQYAFDFKLNDYQQDYNQRTYDNAVQQFVKCLPTFKEHGLEVVSCTPISALNEHIEFMPLTEAIDAELKDYPAHDLTGIKHSSEFKENKTHSGAART